MLPNDSATQLDDGEPFEDPGEDIHGAPLRRQWAIDSLGSLDWALSRLGEIEREAEQNAALARQAIAVVERRLEKLTRRTDAGAAFFKAKISEYCEAHRDELLGHGKRKSRGFIHGKIGWRKSRAGLEVLDEALVLDWARLQPVESGLLRIKEEINRETLGARFKLTGEVPPGCQTKDEHEDLVIKAEPLTAAP